MELKGVIKSPTAYMGVMEYMNGGDVQHWLDTHSVLEPRLTEEQVRHVFYPILLALEYMHGDLLIAHRDIKLKSMSNMLSP